jgi:hypothetical protein
MSLKHKRVEFQMVLNVIIRYVLKLIIVYRNDKIEM